MTTMQLELKYVHLCNYKYRIFLLYHVTSRSVRKRTVIAEYCGFVKGLRIFRRRKVAGATSSES